MYIAICAYTHYIHIYIYTYIHIYIYIYIHTLFTCRAHWCINDTDHILALMRPPII